MQTLKQHVLKAAQVLDRPWMWILFSAGILSSDFFTGPFIQFPIAFVLPVTLAAWHRGAKWALGFAIILPLVRFSYSLVWKVPWTMTDATVNLCIRITILAAFAVLTARVARQNRELLREVKLLKGILPICGFCKKIRDEQGNWQQLESYISKKTDAQFSHSFCPECGRTHYAEYLPT
jgi:hypothetical protein